MNIEISDEHKKFIQEFQEKHQLSIEKVLRIDNLIFTIKGKNDSDNITPKTVKIRQGFKVTNDKEYEKAIEKFSQ